MEQKDVEYWANLVIGLLDQSEWKVLLSTLAITFALTYTLKLLYFSLFFKTNSYHIRLIAIVGGFIAAKLMWSDDAISMQWYVAGILMGPLSIMLHESLAWYSKTKLCKATTPWLYPLVRGRDRRSAKR
jgi:hypothetical protein